MPIVDHVSAVEIPWRPGYRRFTLAGKEEGVACSASLSILEPGAGAPTHFHNAADEVIIVLEGTLEMWIVTSAGWLVQTTQSRCRLGCRTGFAPSGRGRPAFSLSCRN